MPPAPIPFGITPRTCPRGAWSLAMTLLFFVLVGCSQQEGIETYKISKKVPEQLLPGKDRLVAVMIPRGDKVWFFKILGPQDSVDLVGERFRSFVTAAKFDDNGDPVLKPLPEGWRRGGKKPMRFATIDINTEKKQLDLSVSSLPAPATMNDENWQDYVAQNVNRWRGQVGMDPSSEPFAGAETLAVEAAKGEAIWVDLIGQAGAGSPPMMGPMSGAGPMMTGDVPREPAEPSSSSLDFETPDGWQEQPARGMREAAFKLEADGAEAEVTVITAGGNLRNNVARWMGQVAGGTPEDSEVDEMLASAEKFEVSGRPAQRFIISGDGEKGQSSIDATIVEIGEGRSKFVKMTGDPAVVAKESKAMRTFLDSLTF